jgi:hypothetical protein
MQVAEEDVPGQHHRTAFAIDLEALSHGNGRLTGAID